MNNRKRANGIAGGVILIIVGIILLMVTFPAVLMSILIIAAATSGLYFLFKTISNIVKDHLDEAELNRQYMNRAYREAKDATAKKPKIEPKN